MSMLVGLWLTLMLAGAGGAADSRLLSSRNILMSLLRSALLIKLPLVPSCPFCSRAQISSSSLELQLGLQCYR